MGKKEVPEGSQGGRSVHFPPREPWNLSSSDEALACHMGNTGSDLYLKVIRFCLHYNPLVIIKVFAFSYQHLYRKQQEIKVAGKHLQDKVIKLKEITKMARPSYLRPVIWESYKAP